MSPSKVLAISVEDTTTWTASGSATKTGGATGVKAIAQGVSDGASEATGRRGNTPCNMH